MQQLNSRLPDEGRHFVRNSLGMGPPPAREAGELASTTKGREQHGRLSLAYQDKNRYHQQKPLLLWSF